MGRAGSFTFTSGGDEEGRGRGLLRIELEVVAWGEPEHRLPVEAASENIICDECIPRECTGEGTTVQRIVNESDSRSRRIMRVNLYGPTMAGGRVRHIGLNLMQEVSTVRRRRVGGEFHNTSGHANRCED